MAVPTLHGYAPSGSCCKIRLTAAPFGVPIERRHDGILKGESQAPKLPRTINANAALPCSRSA